MGWAVVQMLMGRSVARVGWGKQWLTLILPTVEQVPETGPFIWMTTPEGELAYRVTQADLLADDWQLA